MVKTRTVDANGQVIQEICAQPQALNDLIGYYTKQDGLTLLESAKAKGPILFTGMGASYHAARVGAELCIRSAIDARPVQTSDLLEWPALLLDRFNLVIYISQSGASAEVVPFLKKIKHSRLIAVTNDTASPLSGAAAVTLPLLAGKETLIASKTYVNSLALVWLIDRFIGNSKGVDSGNIESGLNAVRRRLQLIIEGCEMISERWRALMDGCQTLVTLGNGLQAISARQCSLMLAEWAKIPSTAHSFGDFKHGFVELLDHKSTVLAFQSSAAISAAETKYLNWMEGVGANVIRVCDGFPQMLHDPDRPPAQIDLGLSSILDAAAGQLLAVQMARSGGFSGFRYLSKIVS